MLKELLDILEATKNTLFKTPEVEEEAVRRMGICAKCPHRTKNNRCGKCGCPLEIRTRSTKRGCPDDPPRW